MPILSYLVAGLATAYAYTFASTETVAASGTHTHTVIYLHGTCGTGTDAIQLFQPGEIMNKPGVKYIAPSAPLAYNERDQMTCNSWFGTKNIPGDQWFLLFLELATFNWCGAVRRIGEITVYQSQLVEAIGAIRDLINTEEATLRSAHSETSSFHRILIGGNSQGGLTALSTLLRSGELGLAHPLGGVFTFIAFVPTTPTTAAMHTCFPFAPLEVPTGSSATVIKNTPMLNQNGLTDIIVPWFVSDLTFGMFRPLYWGTPNYGQNQEWVGHTNTESMHRRVAAFFDNIIAGRDPFTPKTEASKGWYNAMKAVGIYDTSLLNA